MSRIILLLLAITSLLLPLPAQARRHHHHRHYHQHARVEHRDAPFWASLDPAQSFFQQTVQPTITHLRQVYGEVTMLAHPAGCPARLFCACGAAVELGLNPRTHMAARSYYQYPAADPGPNRVAVRPHHVFVLKRHIEGLLWLVADYNSGGHASRLHVRSIAGYSIRAPRG